ncbi:iron-sulfur cluster biosynthesis family protein [Listeria swaminathanii]|uniref:Iron-sulfur cluster biosynthesis family protein n=1 Tax=Listeria swaminathanii TaxID=2713501 RepID=A0ABU2ID53_9LIST|nr:iron-sulfur cluster biosynthesis family protein [Listeria swaminathanii]MDT0016089.1 iron-sulfur cluster biosynthesis family protein [Listeria swaminathanii]MDT0021525.1 iron-sulfur cluster biosynthesis family protein [Listeria swaminathanii]MDT0032489.1 iron-sulfur cluster biosynthesis family protein [Listeria swaminathanii]MDT0051661.1 iron-sulfur cluster biosynthesis family protein [Listeria swaminathanii]MDT0054426.1 iron-sulfur cluster biosynthesis family protein [Listeria swaminathani
MHITFTDSAKNRLAALRSNLEGRLHLYYDTEGCSCENSGIFTLRLVEEKTAEDNEIESNIGPVLIKRWTEIFLEEALIIDYDDAQKTLILKSDGQYYNRNLLLVTDKDEVISCPVTL